MTPPSDFTCPITKKLMVDPVVSLNGINFERSAILKWIRDGNNFCPVTSAPLRLESLRTSTALQWKIKYFQMKHDTSSTESETQEQTPNHLVIPQKMLCLLTKKIMVDPIMTKYGHSYERAAILKWIGMRGEVCPMTGKPLTFSDTVTNSKLSWQIAQWERKIKNGNVTTELPDEPKVVSQLLDKLTVAPQLSKKKVKVVPQLPDKLKVVGYTHSMEQNSRGLVGNCLQSFHRIPKGREGSQCPTNLDRNEESVLSILEDVVSTMEIAAY